MAAYRMARWALPASVAATLGATATMPADRWPAFAWGELSANPRDATVELFLSPADGGTAAERWFLAHDERLALLARPVDGSDEQLRIGPVDRGVAGRDRGAHAPGRRRGALPRRTAVSRGTAVSRERVRG